MYPLLTLYFTHSSKEIFGAKAAEQLYSERTRIWVAIHLDTMMLQTTRSIQTQYQLNQPQITPIKVDPPAIEVE